MATKKPSSTARLGKVLAAVSVLSVSVGMVAAEAAVDSYLQLKGESKQDKNSNQIKYGVQNKTSTQLKLDSAQDKWNTQKKYNTQMKLQSGQDKWSNQDKYSTQMKYGSSQLKYESGQIKGESKQGKMDSMYMKHALNPQPLPPGRKAPENGQQ
jgi:hypothetical protein